MVWKAPRLLIVTAISLVTCLGWAHSTRAAEVIERKIFYLDWGFIGHPVSLDVDGGATRVSWEAGDLTAPTILMIETEADIASTSTDGVSFGDKVIHVTWADPYHLSARGVKIESTNGCNPGGWNECALYVKNGDTWKQDADGRAYGHVRVRMGTKKGSYMRSGSASWYKYKNCRCAASVDFPKGTRLRVRSVANPAKYTVIRVNDYGPERDIFPDRAIDLDLIAFQELAPKGAGVIRVTVEPVASSDPDYAMADALPAGTITKTVAVTTTPTQTAPSPTPTWSY
jgi:hypothetical protein